MLFPRARPQVETFMLFIPCSKFEMDFHFANLEVTHDEDDVILRICSIPESQKAHKKSHYKKSWLSHITSDLAAKITTSCTWSEIFFLSKPGIARSYSKQMPVNKLR